MMVMWVMQGLRMDDAGRKKAIISFLLERGVLLDHSMLSSLESVGDIEQWYQQYVAEPRSAEPPLVLERHHFMQKIPASRPSIISLADDSSILSSAASAQGVPSSIPSVEGALSFVPSPLSISSADSPSSPLVASSVSSPYSPSPPSSLPGSQRGVGISTADDGPLGYNKQSEAQLNQVLAEQNASVNAAHVGAQQLRSSQSAHPIGTLQVVRSYERASRAWVVQDFVAHYAKRLSDIEQMLRQRSDLQGVTSIKRILERRERGSVAVIGLVTDKATTKNGNVMLTLEDSSGSIKVVVKKTKPDVFEVARDLVLDEVIGVVGANADKIIFGSSIIQPDVPVQKELRKAPDEVYAAFLSDIHAGSTKFLGDELQRFLDWLSGNAGSEQQRELARKVQYVFIAGDLVDGVGIYPNQDNELRLLDIYEQYEECARFVRQIPSHIHVIVCPGNHDAVPLSEPQPPLSKKYAKSLWEIPNVTMVSNPALVNIHASGDFPGFDVLLYHGYSFDYYVANVDGIRNQGGYDRADIIMKSLLRKRHLAPSHKSTLYIPDPLADYHVIDRVPDFLITGHIHKCSVANYRNVTLICGSCWQGKTAFQEKMGHHPEPCRVPLVNLRTRAVKILKFGDDE